MKLITPVTLEKKHALQEQLWAEQRKLFTSTRLAIRALKTELNPVEWIKKHPIETTLIVLATGMFIGKNISTVKKQPPAIELT